MLGASPTIPYPVISDMTDRARAQADLVYQLGLVLAPFQDLVENPKRFTSSDRSRISAWYHAEKPRFLELCGAFAEGEPGHRYQREFVQIKVALATFDSQVMTHLDSPDHLRAAVETVREALLTALLRVPTDAGTVLTEAGTPFSTALALRSRLETARSHVTVVDRYIDGSVFFRLLSASRPEASVTVLTWPEAKYSASRWQSLMSGSRVFAQERPTTYSLVVSDNIHARWLRADDRYYIVSESFKDAGFSAPLSLTLADDAPLLATTIVALIANGQILFGPTQPVHP